MQRFIPYPDFYQSAEALDSRRLNKQILESLQLGFLDYPCCPYKGWRNHPARHMWRGYVEAACTYGIIMCLEYMRRHGKPSHYNGHKLSNIQYFLAMANKTLDKKYTLTDLLDRYEAALKGNLDNYFPPWFNDAKVHDAHKSNLYRKDPAYYSQFEYVTPDLPYVWKVEQ